MPPLKTTTAIAKSSNLPVQSMSEIATAGNLLAQAGYLGTKNAGEGFLVLASCQQMNISLVEFQQKFHFRQGRFSMSAHAILAEFENRGGKHEMLKRTPEEAFIKLTKDGKENIFSLTWEQCKNEPFIYAGNENEQLAELAKPFEKRKIKNKYQTPRSRMQMLWARVISDAVATVDPAARMGYTPEETDDIIEAQAATQRVEIEVSPESASKNISVPGTKAIVRDAEIVDKPTESETKTTKKNPVQLAAEMEVDYSVCPVGPEGVKGAKWDTMEDSWLKNALEINGVPEMTENHKKVIRSILSTRDALKESEVKI